MVTFRRKDSHRRGNEGDFRGPAIFHFLDQVVGTWMFVLWELVGQCILVLHSLQ